MRHKGVRDDDEAISSGLGEVRPPKVLVLNKVDLVDKPLLLTLAESSTRALSPRRS
jgi:GTP-binding protein Era